MEKPRFQSRLIHSMNFGTTIKSPVNSKLELYQENIPLKNFENLMKTTYSPKVQEALLHTNSFH